MCTNAEMTTVMAEESFAKDRQRFLRGSASADSSKYWLALKEEQNLVLNDDLTFVLWMSKDDGTRHSRRWKVHPPGTSRLTVWMKRRHNNPQKLWTRLGEYTFGKIVEERHIVTKYGKAYHTDIARLATPVIDGGQ